MLFLLILLVTIGVVFWIERSFLFDREPLVNDIVPISFPGQGNINIPAIIQAQPRNGQQQVPLQIQGPVKLGIQGSQHIDFSTGQNRATIGFMNNGRQAVLETTGGSGQNDGNMRFQSQNITFQSPVSITGRLDAPKAVLGSLKVNRSDADRYPNWGAGIHTWDLYANGTIGAGNNGDVRAYLNRDGNMGANGTSYLNQIVSNTVIVGNRNILGELNSLQAGLNQVRSRI